MIKSKGVGRRGGIQIFAPSRDILESKCEVVAFTFVLAFPVDVTRLWYAERNPHFREILTANPSLFQGTEQQTPAARQLAGHYGTRSWNVGTIFHFMHAAHTYSYICQYTSVPDRSFQSFQIWNYLHRKLHSLKIFSERPPAASEGQLWRSPLAVAIIFVLFLIQTESFCKPLSSPARSDPSVKPIQFAATFPNAHY